MSQGSGRITDTESDASEAVTDAASDERGARAASGGSAPRALPPPPVVRPPTAPPPPRRAPTQPGRRRGTHPEDVFTIRGLRSPLVGRGPELARMLEIVQQAIDFKAPQLITVVGNQGTGKSRLVDELVLSLPPNARVFHGRAPEDGARYAAVSRLLRDRFAIGESADPEVAREDFRREVQQVFDDQRVSEVLHFLGQFLDLRFAGSPFLRVLGESPAQHDEITRTVLRRFIEVDAERSPLVLVFDDLQWADEDTLSLLQELGASLGGSPVVLVACTRPELMMRLADWGEGVTDHLRVDVRNLEPAHAEEMFRHLLSRCDRIPDDIVEDAVEMTGGNPYFLEQLVRLFLANGTIDPDAEPWRLDPVRAADTELPISIEEAIEARIANLEAEERDVLEKGAVFGNVFWIGAVVGLSRIEQLGATPAATGEPAGPFDHDWSDRGEAIRRRVVEVIDELVERDYLLMLDPEDSTIIGDVELVFKHNLERELIAKSTQKVELSRYHRLAAQWLETKLSARSEEQLEFLAQLYERGGDRRRAAHCYLAGGDKARRRYANEQAVELYRRGLAMLEDDAVAELEALHNLGSVLDLVGRTGEAQAQFTLMLRRAWLFDHKAKGGAAHSRLGRIHRRLGEYDQAMAHLRAANDLFARAEDRRGIAGTLDDIGQVHWLRGAYGQALDFHRQALSIRRALGDRRSIALCLANIGRVHHDSGAFKAATRQFKEALELRRQIGDLSGVVASLSDLGTVHTADGSYEMALEMFSEAKKIAEEIGDKLAQIHVLACLGECLAAVGRGPEAVEHLMEGVSLAGELGNQVGLAHCRRRLAEVFLGMGDASQALDQARQALAISEEVGSRVQVGTAHRAMAEALAMIGSGVEDPDTAERHFRKAIEILAGMKNELELARCYRSFAGLRERAGSAEEAQKLRRRAEEIFGRLRGAAAE